jgi:hypothetical protein
MMIGVDYHPSFQQIAILVEQSGEYSERRLNHSDGEAEKFHRELQLQGVQVRVGMEATRYSRWFERLLAELGFEVWIGDPAEIKTKRVKKQKTDRQDAQLLLKLMMAKAVLREIFRGKFVDALEQAFQNGQLRFEGDLKLLAQHKIFAAWLRPLYRQDWVVYLKRPFGGPEYVLHYLGRYTHRVAISNHRLVSLTDGQVTFRWRDSAHHNEQKLLSLSVDEFLRRFVLHILPKGFVRIRNFGFLANRKRATLLPLCFPLLGSAQQPQAEQHASSTEDCLDLWRCPKCGGPMKVIERLTAAEIQLRSPPRISSAA